MFVSSYFKRTGKDYGTALTEYWIRDHIRKAKEGIPPHVMQIFDKSRKRRGFFGSVTVLDLCCGWGEFVANCLVNGFNCYGVDKAGTIGIGSKLLEENGLRNQLIRADAFSLPFKKETFDVVFSFTSLEHIQNPRGLFQRTYSVLKENGILFISFPNALYPIDGHTLLWGVPYLPHNWAEKYVKFRRKRKEVDQWDVWYHRKREVIGWLRLAGFRKVESFIYFDNSENRKSFLKRYIISLVKKLNINLYAILSLKAPMVFMIAER